jgi:signal transduction histidine kinase
MTPLWIDGRLLLARRITAAGHQYVQGCLLDWPAVKASLLQTIEDLLPGADLRPVEGSSGGDESRLLAALPVRLLPGPVAQSYDFAASPILLSLAVAWACVLVAAVAVAGLLWGVIRLSERRAAFVSAVTHELRTPLTTFRMYAEMLSEGMVPDPQQQQQYLQTLQTEAGRLTHLVENVLAYARLERGRRHAPSKPVALGDFLRGVEGRLAARAQQAGMTLVTEGLREHARVSIRANPSVVEQVLLNLVDNACKYASAAADKRVHLAVRMQGEAAEILVRDHGPGVSAAFRRRLFRSFSKSAQEAAQSAPGIGLGLALSRRLARDMGGNLCLDPAVADGACFVLSLPAVRLAI